MAQGRQILYREIPPMCQRGIKSGSRMSLRQHKSVSVRFLRVLGINVHLFKIKIGKNIRSRKRSAGMSGLCAMHCCYNALADFVRHTGKL